MPATPDADVVTKLAAGGLSLTSGTNLFAGPVRPEGDGIPGKAVFVLPHGGPAPESYFAPETVKRRYSGVQVRIRGAVRDFGGARTLARGCRDALHNQSITGYLDVRVMQSEPLYLGEDEKGHHEFSVNLELWHED